MPKTYKNISGFTQFGIEPGDTGECDLTQAEEDRAVARGALEVVGDSEPPEESQEIQEPQKTPEEIAAEQKAAEDAAAAEQAEREQRGRRGGRS